MLGVGPGPHLVLLSSMATFTTRNRMNRFWLSTVWSVTAILALLVTTPAQGALSCAGVFNTPNRPALMTELNRDFVNGRDYDVRIPQQSEIKDQCNLGTCHLHAWATQLEVSYPKSDGTLMNLDTKYWAAKHLVRESYKVLRDKSSNAQLKVKVALGADPVYSRTVIMQEGALPAGIWTPARDFTVAPFSERLQSDIANIIARSRMNQENATTEEAKKAAMVESETKLLEVFKNVIGPLPESFQYEGAQLTPQEFMTKYFSDFTRPLAKITVQNDPRDPVVYKELHGGNVQILTSVNSLERIARELLDQGKPVYLSYEHAGKYVDKGSGTMAIGAWLRADEAKPLSRDERDLFDLRDGFHAVELIGYKLDPDTGRVSQWLMQNSWGDDSGDKGLYHMHRDFFRAFARDLTIYRDSKVTYPKNPNPAPANLDKEAAGKPAVERTTNRKTLTLKKKTA